MTDAEGLGWWGEGWGGKWISGGRRGEGRERGGQVRFFGEKGLKRLYRKSRVGERWFNFVNTSAHREEKLDYKPKFYKCKQPVFAFSCRNLKIKPK